MQLIMSGVLNVTQLIGVVSSLWTLDRFGRRKLLMYGSVFMTISHVVIAALVGQYSSDWPSYRGQGWTSVGFLFLYMLAFGASWGPVPWAMPAEVFPSSLRAKGVSISTCSSKILFHTQLIRLANESARLAEQLHRRSYYAAIGAKHRVRGLCLFRSFLLPIVIMDLFLRSRDHWKDIGANGRGV